MRSSHTLALCLFLAGAAQAQDLNVVTSVEVKDEGNSVTVSVKGSKPPNFTTFSMADPARFVIDLSETRFQGVPEDLRVDDGVVRVVKNLAYGSGASAIARVMIAFSVDVEPPEVQTDGNSLLVRVAKPAGAAVAGTAAKPAESSATASGQPAAAASGAGAAAAAASAVAKSEADEEARQVALAREQVEAEAREQARKSAEATAKEREAQAQMEAQAKVREAEQLAARQAAEEEAARVAADARRAEIRAKAAENVEPQKLREEAPLTAAVAPATAPAVAAPAGPTPAELAAAAAAEQAAAAQSKADAKTKRETEQAAENQSKADAVAEVKAKREAERTAAAQSKADAKTKRETEQAAENQSKADAKAEAKVKRDAEQAAENQSKEEVKAKRVAEQAAAAQAAAEARAAAVAARPARLQAIGFKQLPTVSRVFVKTSTTPRFTITDVGDDVVRLEVENTHSTRRNDTRPLDTSFFASAVTLISPSNQGTSYVVDIRLKKRVPYQQKVEGELLAIDFERPPAAAAAGAVEGLPAGTPSEKALENEQELVASPDEKPEGAAPASDATPAAATEQLPKQ